MTQIIDTLLLLALPASGKSEVRRYLAHLDPVSAQRDFHFGPTVQLDDFPYVHLMRRIDDELLAMGEKRVFFISSDRSFFDGRDWGTLIELLNQDYYDLVQKRLYHTPSAAYLLFDRLDAASKVVGLPARMAALAPAIRGRVASALEKEARENLQEKLANYPESLEGKTLVIEFARGGKDGSAMPIPAPQGYQYSISLLAPEILAKARILYIWVTPEESRRKNHARTDPNDPGSILHHGVPLEVMLGEYGCDDMTYLEENAVQKGTITLEKAGKKYNLPIARFDNRQDRTTFVREAKSAWKKEDVDALHGGLKRALDTLAQHK